ncbi:unnamed protein product [Euphydryas editha]|uniref:Uncharacterized protein n=1 Tax=Euphydryas editha TaxID=104508 RepID=A0AAU9UKU7_EUPED|nr:unnamed protein product [Euphydryas editha]
MMSVTPKYLQETKLGCETKGNDASIVMSDKNPGTLARLLLVSRGLIRYWSMWFCSANKSGIRVVNESENSKVLTYTCLNKVNFEFKFDEGISSQPIPSSSCQKKTLIALEETLEGR